VSSVILSAAKDLWRAFISGPDSRSLMDFWAIASHYSI